MRRREGMTGRRRLGVTTLVVGFLGLIVLARSGEALAQSVKGERVAGPTATVRSAAATGSTEEFSRGEPQVEALWKLARGLHNLALGLPAELLQNPAIEASKADTVFGFGAGATEGVLVGLGKGVWRMGAGFLDIVTFPCPIDPWYDPEVLPPYPF